MIVYITTNNITGQKYIGKDEKNCPVYYGSGVRIRKAILKYGKENFTKEVLCTAENREQLIVLEKYYIRFYNADISPLFYNIAEGGDGGKTSDQSHKKVKVYQFSLNGMLLKDWDSARDAADFYKIQRSKIVSCCKSGVSYNKYIWSKKPQLVDFQSKIKYNKPIYQYTKDNVLIKKWDYLQLIEDTLLFNRGNIQKCANGTRKSAYGYLWKHVENCP